jgi:hypothetical protein
MPASTPARRSDTTSPQATLPGPSRRITVEPVRVPVIAPAAPERPEAPPPDPHEEPAREPVPAR